MPIDPIVLRSTGDPRGIAMVMQDLDRRLRRVEAVKVSLGDNTVTNAVVAPAAIGTGNIQAGSITASTIGANAVTTNALAANSVTATAIAALSINTGHLQANAVTAGIIAADSIYTAAIQAGAVTAAKITVTTLSALTSNMGAITAGTITGGTVQSAASGSRVVLDSAGIRGYALDGVTKTFEINTGTGIASFTGVANIASGSVIPGGTIAGDNTVPGSRIVSNSINTLQLNAGSVKASQIDVGAVTAQKIGLTFGGSNRLYNSDFQWNSLTLPGFAPANDTWKGPYESSTSAIATDATASPGRGKSVALTSNYPTGSNPHIFSPMARVTPGERVTASFWIRKTVGQSGRAPGVGIRWLDSSGAVVRYSNSGDTPVYAGATTILDTWVRVWHTATVPTGVAYADMYGQALGTTATSEVFYVTAFQIEGGEVPSPWTPKADEVVPGSVGNTQIGPDAITTDKIFGGTILGADIAGTTITGTNIAGTTITGANISGVAIDGFTITGPTIQTSASNPKMLLSALGLQALDATGAAVTTIAADGSGQFTGPVKASSMVMGVATGLGSAPYTTQSVRWTRNSDGLGVGHVQGGTATDGGTVEIMAYKAPFNGNAPYRFGSVIIQADRVATSTVAEAAIVLQAYGLTDTGTSRTLLDSKYRSDFLISRNAHYMIASTYGATRYIPAGNVWTEAGGCRVTFTVTSADDIWVLRGHMLVQADSANWTRTDLRVGIFGPGASAEVTPTVTYDAIIFSYNGLAQGSGDWGEVTGKPTAKWTGLTPGVYTAMIFARNPSGTLGGTLWDTAPWTGIEVQRVGNSSPNGQIVPR